MHNAESGTPARCPRHACVSARRNGYAARCVRLVGSGPERRNGYAWHVWIGAQKRVRLDESSAPQGFGCTVVGPLRATSRFASCWDSRRFRYAVPLDEYETGVHGFSYGHNASRFKAYPFLRRKRRLNSRRPANSGQTAQEPTGQSSEADSKARGRELRKKDKLRCRGCREIQG